MNLFNRIRPSFGRFAFVFVGLAISVFIWGLQYKLSLYYPPHSTYHQIPEAKLLSRNEQAPATEGLLTSAKTAADVVGGDLFALTLFVCALRLLPIFRGSQTVQERIRPWLVSLGASLNAFFFRPPPAFA